MKYLTKALVLCTILLFGNSAFALSKKEIDSARIKNTHAIAGLIEQYKEETGHYPLEKQVRGDRRSIQVKIGHPPVTNSKVIKLEGPYIDEVHFSEFKKELQRVLGDVVIPLDPKTIAFSGTNFSIYAVYKNTYYVSCLLNYYHKHVRVIGKNQFKYEVTSERDDPNSAIHYASLSEEEKLEILKILPTPKYSFKDKAYALFQNGDYKGAIKAYKKAIKKEGPALDSYSNMGVAYRRTGQVKKAVESYTRALEIAKTKEQRSGIYFNRALSYASLNSLDNSLSDLTKAIADVSDADAARKSEYYSMQANLYVAQQKDDEALRSFDNSLRLNSEKNAKDLVSRGLLHLKENNLEVAKIDFKKAVEIGSKDFLVKISVASYYAMYEHTGLAVQYMKMQIDEGLPNAKKILQNERFDKIRQSQEFKDVVSSLDK